MAVILVNWHINVKLVHNYIVVVSVCVGGLQIKGGTLHNTLQNSLHSNFVNQSDTEQEQGLDL
jgi:hypothetical protein